MVRVLTAVVLAGVLLAGCGDDPPAPAAPASTAAPAATSSEGAKATGDLRGAVDELAKASYRYTMKAGDASGAGTVDPAAKTNDVSVSVAGEDEFKTQVLVIGPELYAKITGLGLPGVNEKKWLRIDRSKIKSFAQLGILDIDDPTGVRTLATTITTIQKTGDRAYKGTLDLSKGTGAFGLDAPAVRQLGEQAKAIPFEATVTEQGKLATWKMTVPAHGAQKETAFELAFSEQGGSFPVAKPTDVVNAPQTVYQILSA